MVIKGLRLPQALVDSIESGRLLRAVGSWQLKRFEDAFGHPLDTELGDVFESLDKIQAETRNLPTYFVADGVYGTSADDLAGPGAIPDILDFSLIVCFAISGDGAPFCLDYRENLEEPAVIWWADVYWRRIAPSFRVFLALFDLDPDSG